MRGVAIDGSEAGGRIHASQQRLFVDGIAVIVLGDAVDPHGDDEHDGAIMVEGSSRLFVGGIPVVREGHAASCGHTATNVSPKLLVSD